MATAEESPVLAVAARRARVRGTAAARGRGEASWMRRWATLRGRGSAARSGSWWPTARGRGCAAEADAVGLGTSLPRAVVSTGFCGALDPELRVGDIWAAERGCRRNPDETFKAREPRTARPARRGAVLSIDRVASTAAEKARLADRGAAAVEMEAAAVAAAAESRGTALLLRPGGERHGGRGPADGLQPVPGCQTAGSIHGSGRAERGVRGRGSGRAWFGLRATAGSCIQGVRRISCRLPILSSTDR